MARIVLAMLLAGLLGNPLRAVAQSAEQSDDGVGTASAELETPPWSGWWYPEPTVRNGDRDLVSPGLDRQTVANILAGSDGSDVLVMPILTPTGVPRS